MDLTGAVEGMLHFEGGEGSTVVVSPVLLEGVEIARITVDDTTYYIYAPSAGSEITVTPSLSSGTKIGEITVDGVTTSLYAPTPIPPTTVTVTPTLTEGTKIGDITVGNVTTSLYAPESGSGGGVVYSSEPHIVGTWTDGNVTKDVWECTFIFPPQYYGEGQHDLTSLNIDRMLMMQGLTNITTASYQTPFYQNNSNFEFYRWQSPNLVVLQPSDWYGKERDRTVTIRYTTSS